MKTVKLLKPVSEFETLSTKGLRVVEARKGFLRYHFVVQNDVLDQNGNWQAGAIATMIDNVGASSVYSIHGIPMSVDFSVSYFSTVKSQEEIEIVAKVVAQQGSLVSYVVEITRKNDGELIAVGKQWMAVRSQKSKL